MNAAGDFDPLAVDPAEIVRENAGHDRANIFGAADTTVRGKRRWCFAIA